MVSVSWTAEVVLSVGVGIAYACSKGFLLFVLGFGLLSFLNNYVWTFLRTAIRGNEEESVPQELEEGLLVCRI